jgi:hypothetical protein
LKYYTRERTAFPEHPNTPNLLVVAVGSGLKGNCAVLPTADRSNRIILMVCGQKILGEDKSLINILVQILFRVGAGDILGWKRSGMALPLG